MYYVLDERGKEISHNWEIITAKPKAQLCKNEM